MGSINNIMKVLRIISLFQLLLIHPVLSRINVKITNLDCKTLDTKMGHFEKCQLKAVKRDLTEISAYFRLLKAVHNASINLKLLKRGEMSTKPMYQYSIDLCKFLASKRRNALADIFYKMFEFSKYSNLNHTCPYDHDFIVERCRLDTKLLNMLSIPQGEYTITTVWFANLKPSISVNISVRVY